MSRLEDIKARLAAATPGPWGTSAKVSDCVVTLNPAVAVSTDEQQWYGAAFVGESMRKVDRDLVANAPFDLALLLKAFEELCCDCAEGQWRSGDEIAQTYLDKAAAQLECSQPIGEGT